jgi:hypothetical protein
VAYHWAGLVLTPTQHMADHQSLARANRNGPGRLPDLRRKSLPLPEWAAGGVSTRAPSCRESEAGAPPPGNIHTY